MNFTDKGPKVLQNHDVTAMGDVTTGKCLKCPPLRSICSDGRPGLTGALFNKSVTQTVFTADIVARYWFQEASAPNEASSCGIASNKSVTQP